MKKLYNTYKKSGVNMATADKLVKYISKITKKTYKGKAESKSFKNIGSFGSIFDLSKYKYRKPLIVSSTDGVGTKIEIANKFKKFNTIGIDLVAMCVNDLIVLGAKPMFFLDYIATNKINLKKTKKIIDGIIYGCHLSGCNLVGGETAEMPGTYEKNKFDLAGFAVGIVEKNKLLTKEKIKFNDVVLAIPSSGLHSNGFSLVRHVLKNKKIKLLPKKIKNDLLKPTKIYVKEVNKLNEKNLINGCANITGGGLVSNLIRVLPPKHCLNIYLDKIKVKPVFKWLKKNKISDSEMLKTFNLGVGFCLIANKRNISKIKKMFSIEYRPYQIGLITKNNQKFKVTGKIKW